jgi:hypothetical protein
MGEIEMRSVGPPTAPRPFRQQAQALEALLFAQMLRASQAEGARTLAGGDGPFAGMLADLQARAVAESGQTGFADAIEAALTQRLR